MEPLQTRAHPPVKVEPATARTLSAAEPETAVREKARRHSRKSGAIRFEPKPRRTPPPPQTHVIFPTRIPFHLPPNGTGAPASERVPASSGPPVPTRSTKPATAADIPFKVKPPSDDLRPKLTLVPGVEPERRNSPPPKTRPAAKKDERKVALALQVVLQNIPAFQLNGTLPRVPADVRVEFPLFADSAATRQWASSRCVQSFSGRTAGRLSRLVRDRSNGDAGLAAVAGGAEESSRPLRCKCAPTREAEEAERIFRNALLDQSEGEDAERSKAQTGRRQQRPEPRRPTPNKRWRTRPKRRRAGKALEPEKR